MKTMTKTRKIEKDRGKAHLRFDLIPHPKSCMTCTHCAEPWIGIIPTPCKERFHEIVLADCNKVKKKASGSKEAFREAYDKHPLTPFNILKNGCPEYEELTDD